MAIKRTRNNDKDLLIELVKARFKLRYNNSFLGFIWVLLKPLSYFLILYFVFTAVQVGPKDTNFGANLFLGLVMYLLFVEGITFGMNSLLDMHSVILKINFPRHIAVLSSLLMAIINLCVNFVVVLIIALSLQFQPNLLGSLYCIAVIIVEILLIYGLSMILSIVLIRVRDLTHIMELFFQLLFYASAVFYSMEGLSGTTGNLIRLNPLAITIDAARKGFILNKIEHVESIIIIFIFSIFLIIIGRMFFNREIKRVAEYF